MSEQGFCVKCGRAYLSDNHLTNCFQSSMTDADDRIKTLIFQNESLRKELEAVKAHHRFDLEQFRKCDDKLRLAREALEEVASPPYKDSDLKSLLETLAVRAKTTLAELDEVK